MKRKSTFLLVLVVALTTISAFTPFNKRSLFATNMKVNAGAATSTINGEVWETDRTYFRDITGYSIENSTTAVYGTEVAIANTTNPKIYQTERFGKSFGYDFALPNGSYTVRLHFAEFYWGASGKRVFNVNVENGQGALNNYDIFVAAGGKNRAIVQEFPVNLTDGSLNIVFTTVVDNAKISAIEIISTTTNQPPVANAGPDQTITLPTSQVTLSGSATDDGSIAGYTWSQVSGAACSITSPASASTTVTGLTAGSYTFRLTAKDNLGATGTDDVVITVNNQQTSTSVKRINAGSPTLTINNDVWESDYSYYYDITGYSIENSTTAVYGAEVAIANTTNPKIYQTERFGKSFGYNIAVPNGSYTVRLHFAEFYWGASGKRVFNMNVENGQGVLNNYDIFVAAGGKNRAIYQDFPVNLTDGVINIVFSTVVDNAKVSAIEIISGSGTTNKPPVANAGPDQTITLPTSQVTLSGSATDDGSIAGYTWSQVSGAACSITSPASASTTVTGLTAGSYTFRLTAKDNLGATGTDDVVITVNNQQTTTSVKRINAGSPTLTINNDVWETDKTYFYDITGYSAENSTTAVYGAEVTIANTTNPKIYQTERFGKSFGYNIAVPSGSYTVRLHFAEFYWGASGKRVFNMNVENGQGVLNNYDIFVAAGGKNRAIYQDFPVNVTDGMINIVFSTVVDNAKVSAIEVLSGSTIAPPPANLTRQPYLQMGSGNAMTIRWRTDINTDSKVDIGTAPGSYTLSYTDATQTTEHEVRVTALSADTKYYYRIGSTAGVIDQSSINYFVTAPPASATRKIRVAAFGDCGRNLNNVQTQTLSAYQNYTGSNPAELMLLLGDNAYDSGLDTEFQTNFFTPYGSNILRNHVLFTAPGNHDYADDALRAQDKNVAYYKNFTMPANGESGGVASGTKAYYSYNWGNIHFLSLDSYGTETAQAMRLYDTTGPQVTWIKQDLAANKSKWIIAYWHHPPHTMGSHNSDTETELINIRQNFIRILERYGVDMIITGHSHDYERSYLLKGYYTSETSFNLATHAMSSSSAKYDGSTNSCPYKVPGTVYVVAGSAGALSGVQAAWPHNAMPFSLQSGGMFYFEVENNRLDAKFLRSDGTVGDQFTIMKDVDKTTAISTLSGQQVTLTASWIGNYSWSNGATTRSINVAPTASTSYTVTDGKNCVTDKFNITVTAAAANAVNGNLSMQSLEIYPVPVRRGEELNLRLNGMAGSEATIFNSSGVLIRKLVLTGNNKVRTSDLRPGIYLIRSFEGGKPVTRKFVVE